MSDMRITATVEELEKWLKDYDKDPFLDSAWFQALAQAILDRFGAKLVSVDEILELLDGTGIDHPAYTAAQIHALQLPRHVETATCMWRLAAFDTEPWESDCGLAWTLNDGGPVENDMEFCPRCGKRLQVQPPKGEE